MAIAFLMAALTFAIVSNVPFLRQSTITAPISTFILTPALLSLAAVPLWGSTFGLEWHLNAKSILNIWFFAWLAFLAFSIAAAWIATLVCRAIFEFVPPWLNMSFGFRPHLLLQSALLTGGGLSTLVLLGFSGWLAMFLREQISLLIPILGASLLLTFGCIRALLRIAHPENFQPLPFPDSIKNFILDRRPQQL